MQFLNDPMQAAPLIALGVLAFYAVCAVVFGFRSTMLATARALLWAFDSGRVLAERSERGRLIEENEVLRELVDWLLAEKPQAISEDQP